MNGLSTSWKIFRVVCIIQLVLVAFRGMLSLVNLFYQNSFFISFLEAIVYTTMFLFVYQGLSLLNYNYPNIPLSAKQKRSFNILYVVNFLLIAFLFAKVVNTWDVLLLILSEGIGIANWAPLLIFYLGPWGIFLIHLVVLAGMFNLRRQIYQNTIASWYQQFDKKEE